MIKKSIFLYIFLIIIVTAYFLKGSGISFMPSRLEVTGTSSGAFTVEIEVSHSGITPDLFEGVPLSYLHEVLTVIGPVENNSINEGDFLFAAINHDLNSDGDFKDSFPLTTFRGVMSLEKVPLKPIVSPYKYSDMTVLQFLEKGKTPRISRLSMHAAPFVFYEYTKKSKTITIGLGSKERPLEIVELSNPCVLIEVFQPVDNTSAQPSFTISKGTARLTYTNEKIIKGYDDFWLASQWIALPVKIVPDKGASLTVTINNIEKPFAARVSAMMSLEKGIVLKSRPLIKVVK